MKQILLTIVALLSLCPIVQAESVTPELAENPHKSNIVVEGRTWTYIANRTWGARPARIDKHSISIGGETVINDKVWHELILSDILSYQCNEDEDLPGQWSSDPQPKVISYIREEGNSVFMLFDLEALKVYDVLKELIINRTEFYEIIEAHDGDLVEVEVIRIGDVGTQIPTQLLSMPYGDYPSIHYIDQVTFDDFSYMQYIYEQEDFSVVEQLGWIDQGYRIGYFFAPSGLVPSSSGIWQHAILCEVKDSDGTVLFRMNEDKDDWFEQLYNGVGDVTIDEAEAATRWFTPQGVEIAEPLTTGVYIRRTGTRAEKVFIP